MNQPLSPSTDGLILCHRKSLKEALAIGGIIFSVVTLGIGFLLLYGVYSLVPRYIWVKDKRIFADKILPPDGVPFDSITKVTVHTVTAAMSAELARTAEVEFVDQGKRYLIGINRNYYPDDQVEQAVEFSRNAKEN